MSYIFSYMCNLHLCFIHASHAGSDLQINVKIKIVSGSPCGAVAAEAKRAQASWVVLDK